MFHQLFFVMSLSGSLVVLLYRLTYPIAQRYFSHSWRKRILCLSLFFYIVPLPLLKKLKGIVLNQLNIVIPFREEYSLIDPRYTINICDGETYFGPAIKIAGAITFCLTVVAFVLIVKELRQYAAVCRAYSLQAFYETPPPRLERMLREAKEELRIKKTVRLVCSGLCGAPMTIGILRPAIVFPASGGPDLSLENCGYILKHELLHIKNRDLLLKFLALFAIAVHWYNPLCRYVYKELCVVSEINCDYGVIKGASDLQRRQYSRLILDLAVASGENKKKFTVGLVNNDAAAFERRILEMKKTTKNTRPILSCVAMILICIVGTITTFAYKIPTTFQMDELDFKSERVFSASNGMENVEHLPFDYFFSDKEGHVTQVRNLSPQYVCEHVYVEGTTTIHRKDNNSCTVTVKKARRCQKCGLILEGAFISETRYAVCPH